MEDLIASEGADENSRLQKSGVLFVEIKMRVETSKRVSKISYQLKEKEKGFEDVARSTEKASGSSGRSDD